jgi:hypothetical protein
MANEATLPINRLTAEQLQSIIDQIESIKPNQQGRYSYQGKTYTKSGLDNVLKPYRERLDQLRGIGEASVVEEQASSSMRIAQNEAEINRVGRLLVELTTRIEDFRSAANRATTIPAQDNLRSWVQFYTSQANRIQKYVDGLKNGTARVGEVDTNINLIQIEQAAARPATGGQAAQPGVEYGGMPGTGQTLPPTMGSSGPVSAGMRGEQGINQGTGTPSSFVPPQEQPAPERPASQTTTPATNVTPGTSVSTPGTQTQTTGMGMGTQPGVQAPTPGPSFTDPATNKTYQPGEQIGGEDRALPNGGAVVNGVYIPPGIDYTALGQAMQQAGIQLPAEWEKAAREMFGSWYDVFKDDPEMSAFLRRLMNQPEMSDAMFLAELQKTNWWKNTNASAREFARRQVEDPATLNQEIANKVAELRQLALDRGFAVDDKSLNDAALKSIQFGFSQQAVLNHLGQLTLGTAQGPSSLVQGYYGQSIRQTAAQFGVPLSDSTLTKWTSDIATGNQTLASFEAYARDLAKNLYPSLSGGFDRGLTFSAMTDPYAQVASQILEIPTSQIDFTDPKWAAAFTMRGDKGEQMQMSYGEWADYLRTTDAFGYEYTDQAVNKAYTIVNDLAELFGRA